MTDEEMAVNWIRSQGWSEENLPSDEFLEKMQAYLAGLEAGRPKWHKVADGVYPEEGETVLCFCRGYCGADFCATARLYIGYDDKVRRWWTNAGEGKSEQLMDVIAWKEIVFPKEIENA